MDVHSFPISKPNASYRLKVNSYLGDRRVFLPIPNEYPVSWMVSAPLSFEGLLKTHWVSLTHCSPTGILTPIIPLEGVCPIQLNDRAKLWWRQWESNPPHGDCKSSSPILGTFAPIIKRQQVILTFIITQLNDLYSCESVLKVFLGEEFVVYFERVGGIEPSSLDWKSNIISHYTTPANLSLLWTWWESNPQSEELPLKESVYTNFTTGPWV